MHLIVLGCGSSGVEVALELQAEGHTVCVVDEDPAALARLGPAFKGERVAGCGFDRAVLVRGGIERAGGFAALTGDDKVNALAAHVAQSAFKVPRVVARLVDRTQRDTYEQLGIAVIAPDSWTASRARELLVQPAQAALLSLGNGEVEILKIVLPPEAEGRTAGELAWPGEVAPVALVRGGQALVPAMGTVLEPGDVLYLSVTYGSRGRLAVFLEGTGVR